MIDVHETMMEMNKWNQSMSVEQYEYWKLLVTVFLIVTHEKWVGHEARENLEAGVIIEEPR